MFRRFAISSFLGFLGAAALEAEPVVMHTSALHLLDVGNYRVGYQYEGGHIVSLPDGWTGHFEERTGVSFTPWEKQDDRRTLLMHCPWRGGHGRTFAEYDIRLPEKSPLRLQFGVALWRGHTAKSDGVTYRAWLTAGRMRRVLLDRHVTFTHWKDFDFDLSSLAGQTITLHLEVDPGPQGNPSYDFSLWSDPRIVVGEGSTSLLEQLKALKALRAKWDRAPRDLLRLSNRRDAGCKPNVDDRFTNRVFEEQDAFVLEYRGADCRIRYRIPKPSLDIAQTTVQVDDLPAFRCCEGAGTVLARGDETFAPDSPGYSRRPLGARIEKGAIRIESRLSAAGITVRLRERVTISGKSLVITADSEDPFASRYFIGWLGPVPMRRLVRVPYLYATDVRYLPDTALYCSWLLDWIDTNASYHTAHEAVYDNLTDGSRNLLHNVGYVTVSPDIAEVLPNIPLSPSPFFDALASRIVLDIWGGDFARDAQELATLKSYGVDHAAVIKHVWQNAGYDNALPATLPANKDLGGDEVLKQQAELAREIGYLFALHENYVDYYPNFPDYTDEDVARQSGGQLMKAWYNPSTGIQSFALKPTAIMKYARRYSPEIHRRYGTTAAYLDVHTCVGPWFHVDACAKEDGAGKCRKVFDVHSTLFQFERDTHGGPLFGEGARHMFWAGLVDGVEAQVEGGENAPLLVDFDLLKIHPQMINHGMGYYERWLRWGYETVWGRDFPTGELLDKYRSEEIAFGHAGFVGGELVWSPELVAREHHLVSPLQERYAPSRPVAILYEVAGEMVPASIAVALQTLDRVYVRYEDGLQVWCNWRKDDWTVQGRRIPQYCFLVLGDGVQAWTRRVGDAFVDYCETPRTLFVDARPGRGIPKTLRPRDIQVQLARFEDLGNRTVRLAYRWEVAEPPDGEYHVFAHFTSEESAQGEQIAFQQDHNPTTPTRKWRKGDEVIDGPFDLRVPDNIPAGEYKLRIGLYNADGRLRLKGLDDGQARIILGTLIVKEDGSLTWRPAEVPPEATQVADSHPGSSDTRVVDFGKIATNGAVLVRVTGDHIELVPTWRQDRFEISLKLAKFKPDWTGRPIALTATDAQGRQLSRKRVVPDDGTLRLTTSPQAALIVIEPLKEGVQ